MPVTAIVAIVAGVLVLFCLVYGAIRKFSRVTWIGFQIPMAFGLAYLLRFIPATGNQWIDLAIAGGGLMLSVAIPLAIGGILRRIMFSPKRQPPKTAARVFNRLFGAVAALLAFVVFLLVVGVFTLKVFEVFGLLQSELSVVFGNPVWSFFSGYAADLMLLSVFLIVMRAGFRLGLLRAIYVILMFALTAAAVVGAILFTTELGFMTKFVGIVAGWFGALHPDVATVLGYSLVILVVFLVFFLVVMLIGALFNFLIKKINSVRAIAFIDGFIVCILYTAVFLALTLGVYYLTQFVATGSLNNLIQGLLQQMGSEYMLPAAVEGVAEKLAELFSSSPLCKVLFELNPLTMLLGSFGA